jgi:D-sedoheptulose 7-phosphate isomerase
MTDFRRIVEEARSEHHLTVDAFLDRHAADLETLARWCADSLRAGGKILLFGNGGSAADAQHLAAEFVNRFDRDRPAIAAIALATDGSALTSIGNDTSFEEVFARQIEALGRPGDIAVAITTSGTSPNVLAGLRAARKLGLRSAGLLGRDGGTAAREVDLGLIVPGKATARIQEAHILAGHLLCRLVEEMLAAGASPLPAATSSSPGS